MSIFVYLLVAGAVLMVISGVGLHLSYFISKLVYNHCTRSKSLTIIKYLIKLEDVLMILLETGVLFLTSSVGLLVLQFVTSFLFFH